MVQEAMRQMPQHALSGALYPGIPMPMYATSAAMAPIMHVPPPMSMPPQPESPKSPHDDGQSSYVQQLQSE